MAYTVLVRFDQDGLNGPVRAVAEMEFSDNCAQVITMTLPVGGLVTLCGKVTSFFLREETEETMIGLAMDIHYRHQIAFKRRLEACLQSHLHHQTSTSSM